MHNNTLHLKYLQKRRHHRNELFGEGDLFVAFELQGLECVLLAVPRLAPFCNAITKTLPINIAHAQKTRKCDDVIVLH